MRAVKPNSHRNDAHILAQPNLHLLALLMVGAIITHLRWGEYPNLVANIVLLALALFVAYGRFYVVPQ